MMPPKFFHRPITLLGTGRALPSQRVSSASLDAKLQLNPGTVAAKSGVAHRFFAGDNQTAAQLAAESCRLAMQAADLNWDSIDCLVAASATMDQGMPSNAALIHSELGLDEFTIPAFDINASCLGFMTAVDTLSWPIALGRYRNVLIVAADIASCGLDWSQLEASAIFGDGAAAAVIGPAPTNSPAKIIASKMITLSSGVDYCKIPAGGSRYHPTRITQGFEQLIYFRMDGKAVFRLVAEKLTSLVDELLLESELTLDQIDWVIPHQASALAMQHIRKRLGVPPEKVIDIFAEYGNQVAASLPTALDIAIRDSRIQRGDTLLLIGTGAGVSISGMVMVY
jgi:3-oxoacyl-[acyl-carrier-protein] synthase III